MKKKKIIILQNANYSEIVDTIADALTAGIIVEKQLEDGFQFQDLLAALQVQPLVQEIANDFKTFSVQFLQLNGVTAVAAVEEAKARLLSEGKVFGVVTTAILNGLYFVATSFRLGIDTYENGLLQVQMFQNLISGQDLFPVANRKQTNV